MAILLQVRGNMWKWEYSTEQLFHLKLSRVPPFPVDWSFHHVSQWSSHYSCGRVHVCVFSMVTEVIRVTHPQLCAGSIIQSSYQQCKLHFPSRSDNKPIGSGKLEWSSQAWPGISKRCTLIVALSKSHFTLVSPSAPPCPSTPDFLGPVNLSSLQGNLHVHWVGKRASIL